MANKFRLTVYPAYDAPDYNLQIEFQSKENLIAGKESIIEYRKFMMEGVNMLEAFTDKIVSEELVNSEWVEFAVDGDCVEFEKQLALEE
ncbi:MAG: hypothetical protein QM504_01600 [Pseudomonadota bacterium]